MKTGYCFLFVLLSTFVGNADSDIPETVLFEMEGQNPVTRSWVQGQGTQSVQIDLERSKFGESSLLWRYELPPDPAGYYPKIEMDIPQGSRDWSRYDKIKAWVLFDITKVKTSWTIQPYIQSSNGTIELGNFHAGFDGIPPRKWVQFEWNLNRERDHSNISILGFYYHSGDGWSEVARDDGGKACVDIYLDHISLCQSLESTAFSISSVIPDKIPAGESSRLVIMGTGLDQVDRIRIGGKPIPERKIIRKMVNSIHLWAPSLSPGDVEIVVSSEDESIQTNCVVKSVARPQRTYHVGKRGSDSSPGTERQPFLTIGRAVQAMVPFSVCYVHEGTYHETVSGHPPQGIEIRAAPGEKVLLDGTGPISRKSPWERYEGSIYKTKIAVAIWQLFDDGEMMIPARWPNANYDHPFEPGGLWDKEGTWAKGAVGSSYGKMLSHPESGLADTDLSFEGAMAIMNIGEWTTCSQKVDSHIAGTDLFTYSTDGPMHLPESTWWTEGYQRQLRYYMESHLNCLDSEKEWYYDPATQMLYYWAPEGGKPKGKITGRSIQYAFDFESANGVTISGFDFFSCSFRLLNSVNCTIENCNLEYFGYSQRMLGIPDPSGFSATTQVKGPDSGSNNAIRNSSFQHCDGTSMLMEGKFDLVDNVKVHDIDWSAIGGVTLALFSADSTWRRITADTSGGSECLDTRYRPLVEYCDFGPRQGLLQRDGAMIQVPIGAENGAVVRYNWIHDAPKFGIRSDFWPTGPVFDENRSEERRVGKECRSRWSPYH